MAGLLPFLLSAGLIAQDLDVDKYRTIDGRFNNTTNVNWGSAGENLRLMVPLVYADGMAAPTGMSRPNPRKLSNEIFVQNKGFSDPLKLSDFCWVWGQFLDHDIGLTPDGQEFFPIPIPEGDPWFDPHGTGQVIIPTLRNRFDPNTGTTPGNPRRHPNLITAFIDGSGVYGSEAERAAWLRTFEGGKLKVSQGNLLPFNTTTGEYDAPIDENAPHMDDAVGLSPKHFVAGDVRANENPLLASFHTLFVREHNRLAEEIAEENPNWNDEQIYQHARKMVGGYIQSIVYNEYLPAMGVHLDEYQGYNPNVNPQLANIFTAAAFRLGHTLLNGNLVRQMPDGTPHEAGNLTLREAFFNPMILVESGGIDPLLKGMGVQAQQEFDARLIDDVRNFLFGTPGAGGLDLAAINILRGRERGLPDLNAVRRALGLRPYNIFREINLSNVQVTYELLSNYLNINSIDPWVGMLAERRMPGALFGETVMEIITRQFTALRDGDRFFYLNDPVLTEEEKEEIHNTTLHDIIMRNTDLKLMQDNVFAALPHEEICANMTVDVLGHVRTEAGLPVAQVGVSLFAGNSTMTMSTSSFGSFSFGAVPGCETKELVLEKEDDHANGLSTLDLILVQQHILNRDLLDSPYKVLAADVDNSGNISTLDLIKMRKVILSIDLELYDGQPWKFIPEGYRFSDPLNPFADDLPTRINFESGAFDYDQDYIAIKLGDINGSANTGATTEFGGQTVETRSGKKLQLELDDRHLVAGEDYLIDLRTGAFKDLAGYQFGLRFDPRYLEIVDVVPGDLADLDISNFAVLNELGLLSSSWNVREDALRELPEETNLVQLIVRAKVDAPLSKLFSLDQRSVTPEVYDDKLRVGQVELAFQEGDELVEGGFVLYQNQPNPFEQTTRIPFQLPKADQLNLIVLDAAGKVVLQQTQNFDKGYQEWLLDRQELPAAGVYYYRLISSYGEATRKMIVAE